MALHEALSYKDWERAMTVIDDRIAHPGGSDGETPGLDEVFGGKPALHVACEFGAPKNIVAKLVANMEDVCSTPAEDSNWLPLHFAVGTGPPMPTDSVEILLKDSGVTAGMAVNDMGRTPLHLASTKPELCLPETYDLLLAYAPAAVNEADSKGCLPLHLAAGDGSIDQVQRLLTAYPEAVNTADAQGKLPIHWAAMKESPTSVTEALLATNLSSVSQLDRNGKTPLHLIAKNNSKTALEKAVLLLIACPASVHWKAADGKTPGATAKAAGRRAVKMGELLAQWAEALPAAAGAADSPLASVRQRLVWAMAQQPRLGGGSVAHKVPHELAGMVAGWLCDTPQTGAVIGAMLAAKMPVEQVRAAGASRLMHLRMQAARCAAGAVHDNDIQSEWARRMGGGGAGLVMYEGITTESGGGQTGESCSCIEGNPCAGERGQFSIISAFSIENSNQNGIDIAMRGIPTRKPISM